MLLFNCRALNLFSWDNCILAQDTGKLLDYLLGIFFFFLQCPLGSVAPTSPWLPSLKNRFNCSLSSISRWSSIVSFKCNDSPWFKPLGWLFKCSGNYALWLEGHGNFTADSQTEIIITHWILAQDNSFGMAEVSWWPREALPYHGNDLAKVSPL